MRSSVPCWRLVSSVLIVPFIVHTPLSSSSPFLLLLLHPHLLPPPSSSPPGALIYSLNTAALPLVTHESSGLVPTEINGTLPPLLSALHLVLLHSSQAMRLSGAWCVHCLGVSLPSQLSSLLDYCMVRLHKTRGSATATAGYAFAIASLLGTVRYSELGLPTAKAMVRLSCNVTLSFSGLKQDIMHVHVYHVLYAHQHTS